MDVKLPDGTVLRGVPDGTTKAQLLEKLQKNGHDTSKMGLEPPRASDQIPGQVGRVATAHDIARSNELGAPERTSADDNIYGKIFGPVDAGVTLLSGMANGVAAPIVGFAKAALNPNSPTRPEQYAEQFAAENQYQPRTGTGAQLSRMAGKVLEPLGTLPTATLAQAGQAVSAGAGAVRGLAGATAAQAAAQDAAMVTGPSSLRDLVRAPAPAMAGGGAAETAQATLRAQRAANLPVPIKLTRGQLDRTFDQVRFEREAAKTPEGRAINDRYAEQNAQMQQNLDAMADSTGAQAADHRAAGRAVVEAASAKKTAKKAEIKAAYDKARASGDMAEQVDISPVSAYIEKNRSAMRNAPILATAEDEIARLTNGTGKLSINDLEELRKMVGKAGKPNASNANAGYTPDLVRLIDESTAGKGGPAYQQARRQFENYSKEFSDRDVIDKLLRNKPGTKDRAVSYGEVVDHTLLNGSLEDTKHVFRVLEAYPKGTAPEVVAAGQQAAKELRGALINHIKETVFSNSGGDILGNTVGSAAKFKRIVNSLDKEGKLEAIYGKRGAQQIRDVQALADDLYTSPSGTVNSSNNATQIVRALNKAADMAGGVPVVGGAVKAVAKMAESRQLKKKVDAALNPKISDLSGE